MNYRRLVGPLAVVLAVVCASCTAPVEVAVQPTPGNESVCDPLLHAAPATLAGMARRDTTGPGAVAWGDPPITVRCGVVRPDGLTAGALCTEVNGVGWWEQPGDHGTVWTTIGRRVFVEVAIPEEYGNPVNVLVDLADVVAAHDPVVTPCR